MMFADEKHWWNAFEDAPERWVTGVLTGGATVSPYQRADANEVLVTLFRPLDVRDRRLDQLDDSLAKWFENRLADGPENVAAWGWNAYARVTVEALTTALRLPVELTRQTLRDRYDEFRVWAESLSRPGPGDLLGLYLRVLAETQNDRRFLGLWYELCVEAGRLQEEDPAEAESRLDIAIAGLSALPSRDDDAPQPGDELLDGLARWARQLPPDADAEELFREQWALIEALYPRAEGYWAERLAPLLPRFGDRPFVRWWRDAVGLPEEKGTAPAPGGEPSKANTDTFLKKIRKLEGAALEAEVDAFAGRHQTWADATGDHSQLPQALNRVGNALLMRERADLALRLARLALEYDRNNEYNWTLWAMALRRLGLREAAEMVLWEAVRRLPHHVHGCVTLAETLIEDNRFDEAEALFRETITRFPGNPAARTALAHLLIGQQQEREAEELLRKAVRRAPDHRHCRMELGLLLLAQQRFGEVPPILDELERMGAKEEFRSLKNALQRERKGLAKPEGKGKGSTRAETPGIDAGLDNPALAGLRETAGAMRAGFRLSGALDRPDLKLMTPDRRQQLQVEARQQLHELLRTHGSHPAVRLIAMRAKLIAPENIETLAAMAPGSYPLQLALARERDEYRDFDELFRCFSAERPLTATAWMLQDDPYATPAFEYLRGWLYPTDPSAVVHEPALAYLRNNLLEMMGDVIFEAGEEDAFVDHWYEHVATDPDTVRAVIDIALLGMVARETPYAALHATLEAAVAA